MLVSNVSHFLKSSVSNETWNLTENKVQNKICVASTPVFSLWRFMTYYSLAFLIGMTSKYQKERILAPSKLRIHKKSLVCFKWVHAFLSWQITSQNDEGIQRNNFMATIIILREMMKMWIILWPKTDTNIYFQNGRFWKLTLCL